MNYKLCGSRKPKGGCNPADGGRCNPGKFPGGYVSEKGRIDEIAHTPADGGRCNSGNFPGGCVSEKRRIDENVHTSADGGRCISEESRAGVMPEDADFAEWWENALEENEDILQEMEYYQNLVESIARRNYKMRRIGRTVKKCAVPVLAILLAGGVVCIFRKASSR